MPEPLVLLVLLLVVAIGLALTLGRFPALADRAPSVIDRVMAMLDAWRSSEGFWKFLAFGMQMSLMLVAGHALAAAPIVRRAITRLASIPRSPAGAAALVGFVACATALINWGLGLIVGALLAREVGAAMSRARLPVHYPLLCAAGYTGLMIWHGGLSGSAPLSMTTVAQAAKVLPKSVVDAQGEAIIVPLGQTTFSTLNLVISGGVLIVTPLALWLLSPRRDHDLQPATRWLTDQDGTSDARSENDLAPADDEGVIPRFLDYSWLLMLALALPVGGAAVRSVVMNGIQSIGLNEVILLMLFFSLVAHGSLRSFASAAESGASECAGVILQFPIYGAILAILSTSGLVDRFASAIVESSGERFLPLNTFVAASILNMFITSGGGLWGVMGPVALQAGESAGVAPGTMIMAVAYGDQLTNMLQPFWALPLLAITGIRARDIVGYSSLVMAAAGVWIGIMLVLLN